MVLKRALLEISASGRNNVKQDSLYRLQEQYSTINYKLK